MKSRITLIAAGLILLSISGLHAQGFIVPGPRMTSPYLTDHSVEVEIIDQVARVTVHQVFYNPSNRAIEGNYYFPLPPEASITDFEMIVDGKTMKGELLEKEKARKIYEDIVRRQIDPALLEYIDHNLFSARIFPIPPRQERKVTLEYSALLKYDGNVVRFAYPLRGETARRQTGMRREIMSPTGEKSHRRYGDGRDVTQVIDIEINSRNAIKNIYSPGHEVDITRRGDHRASVSYEGQRKSVSESFVLYYSYSDKDFGLSLMRFKDDDRKGYFMILLSPKSSISEREILGKDILFILDTSGSMGGDKIEQARDALAYCINNLDTRDRFNIITFSTETKHFREDMVSAAQNRREGLRFVSKAEARGGTNINDALLEGLEMDFDGDRPSSIVFLTDGLPTVGITNMGEIARNVAEENGERIKIFTFGVGYDVNTRLLDQIAAESRSVADYIEPDENIETKISGFYDKVSHPVMTDLKLLYGNTRVSDVYPKDLPDLFKGSQLAVLGRYSGRVSNTITLKGKVNGKEKTFRYKVRSDPDDTHDFIPHLWATRKIGFLVEEIRLHGEEKELKDEIIHLSKKYGVMSPYTSYLVQEEDMIAHRQNGRSLGIPVMAPQRDKKGEGALNGMVRVMDSAEAPATGAAAVKTSKVAREMKEAESVADQAGVQRTGGRTFLLVDGCWIDSEYTNQKTIDLKAGSNAVVNLMLEFPETAKFLSMGDKVIFKFKGKYVRVSHEGEAELTGSALKNLLR